MFNFSLIPRFKYNYNILDFIFSIQNYKKFNDFAEVKKIFGENIFFTNYARTGLYLLLKSISGKRKLIVGVQAFTCHTIFESIKEAGCEFVFLDINDNFTIDLEDLELKKDKFDILIVTHTFGIPAEINEIKSIIKDKIVIEDCAHSLFSKYKGKYTGTFFDASIYSFGYGKFPSIGPGGMTVINNELLVNNFNKMFQKLPKISSKSELKNIIKNLIYSVAFNRLLYGVITFPIGKKLDKKFDFIGKTHRKYLKPFMSNVNLFLRNFSKYQKNSIKQKENGRLLYNKLCKFYELNWAENKDINFYLFPVLSKERGKFIDVLIRRGYESGSHFSKSIIWAKKFGYEINSCPNTEKIIEMICTIPVRYDYNENDINKLFDCTKGVL